MIHSGATASPSTAPRSGKRLRLNYVLPLLIGCAFALFGLRGLDRLNLPSDAPNHLLNGAFIHDFVRSGRLLAPVAYAREYYAHFPAITIPFHPPVFPAFEALFFAVFGVNVITARLAIAGFVVLCAVLLFRLIVASGGSRVVAAASVIGIFSMPTFTYLATNVMLEFPTLALVLAALYILRDFSSGYSLVRGLCFAAVAGAAVWTKQQAVFLGLVPWALIAIHRRWHLLAGKAIWVSSAVFGAIVLAFTRLTAPFAGSGGLREIPDQSYMAVTFAPRLLFYLENLVTAFTAIWAPVVAAGLLLAVWQVWQSRSAGLPAVMLGWAPAAFAVLFLTGHMDRRYLFFVYPPLMVLGFWALERAGEMLRARRFAAVLPLAAAACWLAAIPAQPPLFVMNGPAETATEIVRGGARRILYCGSVLTGDFIFAARAADPTLRTIVFRADKIGSTLTPAAVEQFAHRYTVDTIVVPKAPVPQPCDSLAAELAPSMALIRTAGMPSSNSYWSGTISVYRFTNPAPKPASVLHLPVPKIGGELQVNVEPRQ